MSLFELTRAGIHMDLRPDGKGGFVGVDVYQKRNRDLKFRNVHHLRSFAAKHGYVLSKFNEHRNT